IPGERPWTITDAAFLARVAQRLDASGEPVAWSGLPPDLEQLLALARHRADGSGASGEREATGFIERLGRYTLGRTSEFGSFVTLLGQVLLLLPAFVTGRAKVRRSEM